MIKTNLKTLVLMMKRMAENIAHLEKCQTVLSTKMINMLIFLLRLQLVVKCHQVKIKIDCNDY